MFSIQLWPKLKEISVCYSEFCKTFKKSMLGLTLFLMCQTSELCIWFRLCIGPILYFAWFYETVDTPTCFTDNEYLFNRRTILVLSIIANIPNFRYLFSWSHKQYIRFWRALCSALKTWYKLVNPRPKAERLALCLDARVWQKTIK